MGRLGEVGGRRLKGRFSEDGYGGFSLGLIKMCGGRL